VQLQVAEFQEHRLVFVYNEESYRIFLQSFAFEGVDGQGKHFISVYLDGFANNS